MDTLYATDQTFNELNYASSNVVYISLPDNNTNCSTWLSQLPSLPSGWSYRCSATPTSMNGDGWIPIRFSDYPIIALSQLPIDPINQPPYYYSFVAGGSYKLSAKPEINYSAAINDGGIEPLLYEAGSNKKLSTFQSGLVLYLPFDEGSGTIARDLSGFGNNGTLCNGTTCGVQGPTWTTGKVGGALSFDGVDDYVNIPHSSILNPNLGSFSILLWGKRTTCDRDLLTKDDGWTRYKIRQGVAWGCRWWTSYRSRAETEIGTYGSDPGGDWSFLGSVLIRISNTCTVRVYVNGVKNVFGSEGTGSCTNPINPIAPLTIGKGDEYFPGLIDEVRLYNRALSDTEIKVLYQSAQ
jgi:hypothetical protein